MRVSTTLLIGFQGAGVALATDALLVSLAQPTSQLSAEAPFVLLAQTSALGMPRALPQVLANHATFALREHAPGCVHCVGSLPFQTALVALLREIRPATLLIEQTADGHTAQAVAKLRAAPFNAWLSLDAVVVAVSPMLLTHLLEDGRETARQVLADALGVANYVICPHASIQTAQVADLQMVLDALQRWGVARGQTIKNVTPLEMVNLASILHVKPSNS
jgi:hypothetical protein